MKKLSINIEWTTIYSITDMIIKIHEPLKLNITACHYVPASGQYWADTDSISPVLVGSRAQSQWHVYIYSKTSMKYNPKYEII